MTVLVSIIGIMAALAFLHTERDRAWAALRGVLLVVTGGVLIAPTRTALAGVVAPLAQCIQGVLAFRDTTAEPASQGTVGATESNHHVSRIIAALVLTAITVILATFDYEFMHLTIAGLWGLPDAASIGVGGTVLTSLALLASLILWGMVALELGGYTRFLADFPNKLRPWLKLVAIGGLAVGLSCAVAMGVWRARASEDMSVDTETLAPVADIENQIALEDMVLLEEPPASSTTFDHATKLYLSAAIPGLVLASSIVSFTGVLWLAKYLVVFGLFVCLTPLAVLLFWVIPTFDNLLAHLLLGIENLVDVLAALGGHIVDTLGPPLIAMRMWAHNAVRRWTGTDPGVASQRSTNAPKGPSERNATPAAPAPGSANSETARDLNWEF